MRHALFALLSLCSLGAVADDNWKPFPHDQSAYDYSGDKLRQAWPQLTRGFGSQYPYPDANWVVKMAKENPKALEMTVAAGSGFSGKPEEAEAYAAKLQDVWRGMFRGDFAKAKADDSAALPYPNSEDCQRRPPVWPCSVASTPRPASAKSCRLP